MAQVISIDLGNNRTKTPFYDNGYPLDGTVKSYLAS